MERKVYCMIGVRCKFITFIPEKNVPDVKIVTQKIRELCERDKSLCMSIHNKSLLLQMKDEVMWCDVDDDQEIPHKSVVNVIFVSSIDELVLPVINNDEMVAIQATHDEERSSQANMTVLYTEPMDTESSASNVDKDSNMTNNNKDVGPSADSELEIEPIPSTSAASELEIKPIPSTSAAPESKRVLPSTPLPPLTNDLKETLKKKTVLEAQSDLIFHWGSFLWEFTAGHPIKQDYQNLASTIVREYPTLNSKHAGCSIIRTTLSQWVRNRRTTRKNQEKREAAKRNIEGKILRPCANAALVYTEESQLDIENSLKELKKKNKEGNTPHIRRLLKITLKSRREWIENKAASISEVVNQYPQLKNSDLIHFEFFNLKQLIQKNVSEKIQIMLQKLSKFFNIEGNDEKSKMSAIINLYAHLSKRTKKTVKPLFSLQETRSSTKDMTIDKGESPRCIVYASEENISVVYIVADQDVHVKVNQPTTENAIITLLAVYYVWHTAFPRVYRNMLEYLDYEILGNSIQKNQVLLKFIHKRDASIGEITSCNEN